MKPSSVKRGCHRAGSACSARAAWAPACAQSRLTGRTGGGAACARAPCAASRRALPPPARKRASSARDHQRPSPARLPRHSILYACCYSALALVRGWGAAGAVVFDRRPSLHSVPCLLVPVARRRRKKNCVLFSPSASVDPSPRTSESTPSIQRPRYASASASSIQHLTLPASHRQHRPSFAARRRHCHRCRVALLSRIRCRFAPSSRSAAPILLIASPFWIIPVGFRYPSLYSYPFHGIPSQAKTA